MGWGCDLVVQADLGHVWFAHQEGVASKFEELCSIFILILNTLFLNAWCL